jgi:FkbM family methyltransferase
MNFIIKYGVDDNQFDVTETALNKCVKNNVMYIPRGDSNRAHFLSDPLYGVLKTVYITNNKNGEAYKYDESNEIFIDISENQMYINDEVPEDIKTIFAKTYTIALDKLNRIHSNISIDYGSFREEFPEQLMVTRYLTGTEKVLEIGGNIGRNSMIIGYILKQKQNNNFVALETDTGISTQLIHNRDKNAMNFFVENAALSKRKLIQKGWDTMVSDEVFDGYFPVNIISWEGLHAKYNIVFDTLVLDCEGAFYYILMDMPEILTNIKTIIMENDYWEIEKKEYVDIILKQNHFSVDYSEAGGWGPCQSRFFEVWIKNR